MDACIIECTTLHKLKQAFLEAGTAYIENVLLMQFCLAEIHLINMFCAINGQSLTLFVHDSAK